MHTSAYFIPLHKSVHNLGPPDSKKSLGTLLHNGISRQVSAASPTKGGLPFLLIYKSFSPAPLLHMHESRAVCVGHQVPVEVPKQPDGCRKFTFGRTVKERERDRERERAQPNVCLTNLC